MAIPGDVVVAAHDAAAAAADSAGVTLAELSTPQAAALAIELLQEVWRGPIISVSADLLFTVQQIGGYAYAAHDRTGGIVAACMGLLSKDGLHSHIAGVSNRTQRRGTGLAVKLHQRAWALDHGIGHITWTCDPIVRRNVAFNIHRLGARVTAFAPHYYGDLRDGLNVGDDSDRFKLVWELDSTETRAAAQRPLPWLPSRWPTVLRVHDGWVEPVQSAPAVPCEIPVPVDIELIRKTNQPLARQWRRELCAALTRSLGAGGRVAGLSTEGSLVVEAAS